MKKTKWIAALCILSAVVPVSLTCAKYVTTLSDEFKLNISAQRYSVTYDAVGGVFNALEGKPATYSTPSQIADPNFTVLSEDEEPYKWWHLFKGWVTTPYSWIDVPTPEYHAGASIDASQVPNLYAVWESGLIYNHPIGGNDGAIINNDNGTITFNLNTINGYEKLCIPLTEVTESGAKLKTNHLYKVTFDYSGTATYFNHGGGDLANGTNVYTVIKSSEVYGSSGYLNSEEVTNHILIEHLTPQQLKTLVEFPGTRTDNVQIDPFKGNYVFVPDEDNGTMYLFLEFSDVTDNVTSSVSISNVVVTDLGIAPVENMISNNWNGNYSVNLDEGKYTFNISDGSGHFERVGIPLYDLTAGQLYTVTFDYKANSTDSSFSLLDATTSETFLRYYGYQVATVGNRLTSTTSIEDNDWVLLNGTHSATLSYTFEATAEQQYLWFEFSNVNDSHKGEYTVDNITVAETPDATPTTYDLLPEAETIVEPLTFDYSGIDENIEWWTIDNEALFEEYGEDIEAYLPYAGFDFALGFEGVADGYAFPETITVVIDDTEYIVSTEPASYDETSPTFLYHEVYDELHLVIPGALLTEETQSVAVYAVAEEIVEDEPVEDEPVEDEPVEDEPVEDEPVEDEPVEDEPIEDEPVEDEPVEDEPVEDESFEDEPVEDEPVEDEPVEDEPVEDEPVEDEPVEDEQLIEDEQPIVEDEPVEPTQEP